MSHIPRHVFASSAYGASRTHSRELEHLLVSYHTLAARLGAADIALLGGILRRVKYNALIASDRSVNAANNA